MKRYLVISALLLGGALIGAVAKAAPPPCWPKQLGSTGSDFKRGETTDAQWLGWTCIVKGSPQVFGIVALKSYTIVHPDISGMTPTKAAAAYYAANVTETNDPRLGEARAAMKAAFQ